MALKTIGTLATNTLQGAQFSADPGYLSNADLASIVNQIYKDGANSGGNQPGMIVPGGFGRNGELFLPERNSVIRMRTGDWVAIDTFGNAFFIPQRALPKTLTLANCTTVLNSAALVFPSNVRTLGWQNGTLITGTNIPANSVISQLSASGLSAQLYNPVTKAVAVATGSASNTTITAGSFTHS